MSVTVPVLRLHRPRNRGPRRLAPTEDVARVLRLKGAGYKPQQIADELRLSKRTVYRYLAEPEPALARRIRRSLADWPDVDALTEQQQDELVAWLYNALAGWHA